MKLKNLLIVTAWIVVPVTVFASSSLWGSASATIENRKGVYIFSTENALEAGEGFDELTSTLEDPESTLVFDSEENLIVDEPDAEEQNLADTLLSDEVSEFFEE